MLPIKHKLIAKTERKNIEKFQNFAPLNIRRHLESDKKKSSVKYA
jgi:hypothetical protein